MARELEKIVVRDKDIVYCYNPSILGDELLTPEQLAKMFDINAYKQNNKILRVFRGRGETYLVEDEQERHLIIRHYWRGGLVGKYLKDKFITIWGGGNRSEEEFNILSTMLKVGLPVPKPVVSRMVCSRFYCRNDIIIQEIPGAMSLLDILKEEGADSLHQSGHSRALIVGDEEIVKIGHCIGMMMAAGVYHSDLNIHNILMDGAKNPWIVDFDKCRLCTINQSLYKKMIDRLLRSFEKEKLQHVGLKWSNRRTQLLVDVIAQAFKADSTEK